MNQFLFLLNLLLPLFLTGILLALYTLLTNVIFHISKERIKEQENLAGPKKDISNIKI